MNRLRMVLSGALHSASLIALLLVGGFLLNALLFGYAIFRTANTGINADMQSYADALSGSADGYALDAAQEAALEEQGRWLMLLDGDGAVIWSCQKPAELPDSYSLADVAGFSRWYLMDYPVRVRVMGRGLLVLGFPKGSIWKYMLESPMPTMLFWPVWIVVALLCNFLLVLVLSVAVTGHAYKKRDAARTEWIAAVSHDVRTPLATVLGFAGSLESEPALPEEARAQAALIRREGEELRALIENLNLTNRLTHSMEPLQAEWFFPASVVRETVVAFLNDEAFSRYTFDVDLSHTAMQRQLHGDRALLGRMLKNLIGNSVRHNPEGCSIRVGLDARGTRLWFTVSDDGVGFSQEQLKKLRGKTMPFTSGHGLGLAIVRQIAAAHGGKAVFSNGAEGGARCLISLGGVFRLRRIPAREAAPKER